MRRPSADNKRILRVTAGNLRQNHLYINGNLDFFPHDCVGSSKKSSNGHNIAIQLDGLNEIVTTDIGSDPKTGKARRFLRGRGWVRRFFEHNAVTTETALVLERVADRQYRLSVLSEDRRPTTGFRAAEFFAGIGLVRLALEQNGIDVVFANDIEPDKLEIYRQNFDASHFQLGDIHALSASDIPDCELFTASFPCNDLSIAGSMKGLNSGQSSAFWGFIDILKGMGARQPKLVLLENVPGFLMSHEGRDFEQAMHALNSLGYACDAVLVDAANFVPQSRLRLFVIAKHGCGSGFPFGLTTSSLRPSQLVNFILGHPRIQWNISDLPDPPVSRAPLRAILEDLPDNHDAWWDKERVAYFMGQLSERHSVIARKMISASAYSYATAFRRVRHGRSMAELRFDGVAGCLRTPRGGSGRQILFKAGKGKHQVRLLTARECARLQGVPEWYKIDVPLNQALFGFGDAVCVPVVSWIVRNCLLPQLSSTSVALSAV